MRPAGPVALLLLAGIAAAPALAQSKGERLDSLESRMDGVERQLANQGLLEMSRQIEALSGQLRQLRGDIDELMSYFAGDAVYHNIPVPAAVGAPAIRAAFLGFAKLMDSIEIINTHVAAEGPVVFTERIDVRRRVRDIAQTPDGRVVLLTDEGNVLVLSEAADLPAGEVAYASCAACHGADLRGTSAGPSLRSLIGRDVAALGDFTYSSALKGAGGQWTRVRLDEFLRDPAAFAPGTSMRVETLVPFAVFYLREPLKLDYLWAGLCLCGAVWFMFRGGLGAA